MKLLWVLVMVIVGWSLYAPAPSSAQTALPKLFLTWRTTTYIPPDFRGKALPTANSLVTASLEVIDGGLPADLSGQTVYWYVENNLVSNEPGVRQIKFQALSALRSVNLRVELPDYNGASLSKAIDIPVAAPEVVIEAPFPRKTVSLSSFALRALPYFFNVKSLSLLSFSWAANREPARKSGESSILNVTIDSATPNGAPLAIALTVNNPSSPTETSQAGITITVER